MRSRTAVGTHAAGAGLGIAFGLLEAVLAIAADRYVEYGLLRLAAQALRRSLNVNLLIFAVCSCGVFGFWQILGRGAKGGESRYLRTVLLLFVLLVAARVLTWSSLPVGMLPLALKRAATGFISALTGRMPFGQYLGLFRRYVDVLVIVAGGILALIALWKVSARFDFERLAGFFEGRRTQGVAAVLVLFWLAVNVGILIDDRINSPAGPNVVLIGIDTLRADHVGCYGYSREATPHIDRLAENAALFKRAISTSSWTLPAFHSIMTSLYQISHGVTDVNRTLDRSYVTLSEVLKNAGYRTAGFISGPLMKSLYGFNQGFDVYDESASSPSRLGSDKIVTSPDLDKLVHDWLNQNANRPFFLFVHYWDPHHDYIPPPPYDRMFDPYYEGAIDGTDMTHSDKLHVGMNDRDLGHIVALYDGEICWTDWHLGRLFDGLKNLGIYENTIVVVVADHGEEFLEHGGKLHAQTLYEEVIRVPLIFRIPGMVDPQEIESVVSVVDVMPTLLDVLNIAHPVPTDGESLLPIIAGTRDRRNTVEVYSELNKGSIPMSMSLKSDLVCMVDGPWKLIHYLGTGRCELYNTIRDTGERDNLIGEVPVEATMLSQRLTRWLASKEAYAVSAPAASRDAETTRQLKALGYIQ